MKKFPGGQSVRWTECKIEKRAAEGDAPAIYTASVSSEYEVERRSFFGNYREVLDHSPSAVQMGRFASGSAAVLEEHRGAPVGVVTKAWIDPDAKKLRAELRFSKSSRGQEVQQDVEDNIRQNVSVGYIPKRAVLVEENEDKGDLWRVTLWEPVEMSFVGVPADPTVGSNRGAGGADFPPVVVETPQASKGDEMKKVRGADNALIEVADDDPRAAVTEQRSGEALRDAFIDLAERYDVPAKTVREWIEKKFTERQAMDAVMDLRLTKGQAQPGAESLEAMGLPKKDAQHYSYARAILGAAEAGQGRRFDGVEWEVHQHLSKRQADVQAENPRATASHAGGFLIPYAKTERTLDTKTPTKGPEVVFEQKGELIELLRNRSALMNLGARSLTGLSAPITFPKQTGPMTAYWVGENSAAVTASDVVLGFAQLTPKTLQATTGYSRQLLATGGNDVEGMVTGEMGTIHALAIDSAGIHGLGSGGEPLGIYNSLNAATKAFGGPASYALVLAMLGKVAAANADLGTLGYLMNPTMAVNLKGVPTFASVGATPVWTGNLTDGNVAGYRAFASNQARADLSGLVRGTGTELATIFGNFADMVIGFWGALELVVDPYSQKKSGLIEVTSFQLCDTLVRHGESFCVSTGATG